MEIVFLLLLFFYVGLFYEVKISFSADPVHSIAWLCFYTKIPVPAADFYFYFSAVICNQTNDVKETL